MNNSTKKYGLSIENFICDEFSICREERQYAVFLYNILRKYGDAGKRKKQAQDIKDIFTECHIPENAFIDKLVINGKKVPDNEKDWLKYKIKWMMNAKPDIAVIYHTVEDNLEFLLFIECKFDSDESLYSYIDKKGNTESMGQREVQWNIAEFLCSCYLHSGNGEKIITPAPGMKNHKSCLVSFVRENADAANSKIAIVQLIELNNKIFQ